MLIVELAARSGRIVVIRFRALFKELHKAVDQPASATDHVQAALVLVLFEDLV
jgi:hypothetical protein